MKFDIYLTNPPSQVIPSTAEGSSYFQSQAFINSTHGFQNLSLSDPEAAEWLDALWRANGKGFALPTSYRVEGIDADADAGTAFAQAEIERVKSEDSLSLELLPARPDGEHPGYWRFAAQLLDVEDAERAPGFRFIKVDKQDGHIWSPVEERELYYQEFWLDAASGISPIELQSWCRLHGFHDAIDYHDQNRPCLQNKGLLVQILPHPTPGLPKHAFGFRGELQVKAKLLPLRAEAAFLDLMGILGHVSAHDQADFALTQDLWQLECTCLRLDGSLTLNRSSKWNAAMQESLSGNRFEIGDLSDYPRQFRKAP